MANPYAVGISFMVIIFIGLVIYWIYKKLIKEEKTKYSIKDFGIDVGIAIFSSVILLILLSIIYPIFGITEKAVPSDFGTEEWVNIMHENTINEGLRTFVGMIPAFIIWVILLILKPYSALYFGILNFSLVFVFFSCIYVFFLKKRRDR